MKRTTRDRMFQDKVFLQKLWKLCFPIALQQLMLASVAAADAFMLGLLDQNSMAAVSLASQIQFVQNMMLSSVVAVVGVLGAQYWGKGDKLTIQKIFCISLRLNGLVSLLFFIGCSFFPRVLMSLFTADEALLAIGDEYLWIAAWSYLLTGISQCYLAAMKVSEHAGKVAFVSTTAVLLNIVLNAILIFGLLGCPSMGARGAAIATLIARGVELLLCVALSYRPGYIRPGLRVFFRHDRRLFSDFLHIMWPLLGAGMAWGVGFTAYTAFVGHMGTDAAAANSVASVVRDLVCCIGEGVGRAAGIMVGNELGAGNVGRGRLYGDRFNRLSWLCGLASLEIMMALTPLLLNTVKLTNAARSYLLGMMLIMAVYMIGRVVNTVVINGVFAAGGDTLFDLYSLGVTMWGLAVPLAALGAFVFHWPVLLVYACTCLDEVGKLPWVMFHYKKYLWVKNLTR